MSRYLLPRSALRGRVASLYPEPWDPLISAGKSLLSAHCADNTIHNVAVAPTFLPYIAEIPVMVAAGWTEVQKRAYVLADNQLAITGSGWDPELLRLELGELKLGGFDFIADGVRRSRTEGSAG
jgi:hypothetical protein